MQPLSPVQFQDGLSWREPEAAQCEALISLALAEDLPAGDLTTDVLLGETAGGGALEVGAVCVARAAGVFCGLPAVEALYRRLDPRVRVLPRRRDGERLRAGEALVALEGPAVPVLRGERIALNFLQRLSGIASWTSRWVRELEGLDTVLVDTRKTTPGWRHLEKYAVRAGGGTNHRASLSDGVLVKDNHGGILRRAFGSGPERWIALLRERAPGLPVQLEVESREEFLEARRAGADSILLDNLPVEDIRWAVRANRELGPPRSILEASGGILLENVREVAATGVDRISVGALTHSAPTLDIALEVERVSRGG